MECLREPVFVLASDRSYFNGLQGAIHTLDTYWPDHKIAFYDLGITSDQEELVWKNTDERVHTFSCKDSFFCLVKNQM